MSLSDPLGDMLTRLRNGLSAHKKQVEVPSSRLRAGILDLLTREGFINGFDTKEVRPGVNIFNVHLKYFDGEPGIKEISRVSKPGRRVYRQKDDINKVYNGLGVAVLSTSKGLMTDHEARHQNIGGEVLFTVF